MKATRAVIVMVVLLSGCGSCQRGEEPTTGGGAAGTSKQEAAGAQSPTAAGKIQVAPLQPTPLNRGAGAATPQAPAAGGNAPAPPAAPGAPEGEPTDEGDCIVVADANPDYGPPPLNVAFSAEAECGTGQLTYKWNFGDGSAPSTEGNPTHTYTKPGDYTASVAVSGGPGTNATDEIDITVEEGGEAPPE